MPDEKLNPVVGLFDNKPYQRPEEGIAKMFEESFGDMRERIAREKAEEEAAESEESEE